MDAALARLLDWPDGSHIGCSGGLSYVVSKSTFANGKSLKLVAQQRGGSDYISANLYLTQSGQLLRPCEMPESKVIGFLADLRLDPMPR